jgi:hypothetical protein
MVKLQYHKGQLCVYGSLFCQEGYCSECEISQNWVLKQMGEIEIKSGTTEKIPAASFKMTPAGQNR